VPTLDYLKLAFDTMTFQLTDPQTFTSTRRIGPSTW